MSYKYFTGRTKDVLICSDIADESFMRKMMPYALFQSAEDIAEDDQDNLVSEEAQFAILEQGFREV